MKEERRMEELKVEVKNRVGILTMNRPEKLNALTSQMGEAAITALKEMADNPEVGAIVLTGAGRGFCAGGDVSAMRSGDEIAPKGTTPERQIDQLRQRQERAWVPYSMPE